MVEHLQEYWKGYIGLLVCALPILYFGRRWVVPITLYIVEMATYTVIMHGIFWCLIRLCVWFKTNSRMYWRRDEPMPPWSTPWTEWWKPENYNPTAIFWIELVLVAFIVIGVIRYRPMKTQKFGPKKAHLSKGSGIRNLQMKAGSGYGSAKH